jgi:ABC-type multidrug transport system fused ATPase/permease subunit
MQPSKARSALHDQMASGVPVGRKTSLVAWFNRHRRYRIGIKVQDQLKSVNKSATWRDLVDYILEVRGVSLRFGGVRALSDVSFGVRQGESFSIIGPNGAGKTSIVNCISGRYRPTTGQLYYGGKDITALKANARA